MRTLRFIGMAIVAVIMSVNFAACSDDDEEGSTPTTENIVGQWVLTYEEGYEIEPEYPEENREWSHDLRDFLEIGKMNANILVILHSELTVHILNMIWIIRN